VAVAAYSKEILMKDYLAAAMGAALVLAAASLTYAQTPPSTDRPKGTAEQTSASPKMDKGAKTGTMKATTKKATKSKKAKKTRTAKRTKQRAASPESTQKDDWWQWRWDDDKGRKKAR
jgi:hypothetical protein